MVKVKLISILLLFFISSLCLAQYSPNRARLGKVISEYGQAEVVIPYRSRPETDRITRRLSISSVRGNEIRIVLSPSDTSWFLNEYPEFRIIEKSESKVLKESLSINDVMEWDSYPSYTQYDSIMRDFAATYPSLCILDTIGTSINGRLILVLKISDNCSTDEPEPEVFYTSTMHGNETGGFILLLRLADYLLKHYNSDSRIKEIIDNLEIWINPLANPDGTYRNGNFIISPVRDNANGYDLNRNFPDPEISGIPLQKETIDMMKFLSARKFVLSANLHSGEEVVNYPWDRWPFLHADDEWFYSVSRAWADTAHLHSIEGYMDFMDNGVTMGYNWYQVYGGRQDYVTYSLSGREITVELDNNFVTPPEDLAVLWEANYRSMINYFENALFGIHGTIEDAVTNNPVAAMIYIDGHDKDNSQVFSDSINGNFIRLIHPGIYDLSVTASGYRDTIYRDIQVISGEATNLILKLNPVNYPDNNDLIIYPVPASGNINVVLPDYLFGSLNVKIFNFSGGLMTDFNMVAERGFPVVININNLSTGSYYIVFRNKENGKTGIGKFVTTR